MKRNLLLVATLVIMCQCFPLMSSATNTVSGPVTIAIKKYKSGNYTGCLQDAQSIVKRDPSNAVAYYYMAMSFAQAGKKDEAIGAYQKVLNLNPNSVLFSYATTGKRCIETPDKCHETEELTEIDKMIASPYGDGLSDSVKNDFEKKRLEKIKNEMNSNDDINNYKLKQFKDYTNQRSQAGADNKLAAEEKMPTNDEIVAALKVLKKAGLDQSSSYSQMNNPMMVPQNAESAQLSMMLGSQNQSGNNNNNMMNMIPFMLAQSKNGQSGGGNPYSPQLMQTMMMNSMLPDFNFNTNDDK
jgi:hypothetical protein